LVAKVLFTLTLQNGQVKKRASEFKMLIIAKKSLKCQKNVHIPLPGSGNFNLLRHYSCQQIDEQIQTIDAETSQKLCDTQDISFTTLLRTFSSAEDRVNARPKSFHSVFFLYVAPGAILDRVKVNY
jgi:hypothetical protein